MNIENIGGRDQSQMKIKFKKFEKCKSVPKDIPKSHNDDTWIIPDFPDHFQRFFPKIICIGK